jgi:hypothetical protein
MLKSTKEGYTLFTANIERAALGARFQFPSEIASVRRLEPNGSATTLPPDGGVFRDRFGPFGVGVYEIRFLPRAPVMKKALSRWSSGRQCVASLPMDCATEQIYRLAATNGSVRSITSNESATR